MRGRTVLIYVLGVAVGVLLIVAAIQRREFSDAIVGVLVLGVVALVTPYGIRWIEGLFPRVRDAAELSAAPVVVYYAPFSPETDKLRLALGRYGKYARWVNVWRDPASSRRARELTDGREVSPTVVVDGELMEPLDPLELKERLRELAPTRKR